MAIGTAAGKEDVLHFTSVGLKRNVEKGLGARHSRFDVLETGIKYYVTIKATTSSGLSSMQHSNGVTVDSSPPLETEVSVSHRMMKVALVAVDIALEQLLKLVGVALFQHMLLRLELLDLSDLTRGAEYFVTVVIGNGAGLRAVMSSKKLVFDTSPPSKGAVIDGNGHDIDFMNSTNVLSIQWGGIEDEESDVASCSWSLIEQSASHDISVFGNDTVVLTKAVESKREPH
ncbi:hypothetical protein OS493_032226 [Desmophyllum pertusum]|uniref:Uncharacterized protein n=1 Tax=Desmophyllum pertusum TaxID=174260 RepID=A0A9X0D912_9CNID|nr:hypothetical protein OS493_032226 [Desmophyllum pertusum]